MKNEQRFNEGDKVFAKVKGYPPWPAVIIEDNEKKYKVKFYGTGEFGQIKVEDLYYYTENKHKLLKPIKRKDYNDSIQEIEEAIKAAGTDGNPNYNSDKINSTLNDSVSDTKSPALQKKHKRSASLTKSVDESPIKIKKQKLSTPVNKSTTSATNKQKNEDLDLKLQKKQPVIKTDIKDVDDSAAPMVEKNSTNTSEENIVDQPKTSEDKTTEYETPPTKVESFKKIDFVLEKELEAFIAFGAYVDKHKELYLKMPVEQRNDSEMQVLPFISDKKSFGIKLHKLWPLKIFENEYERAIYDKEISQYALDLKKSFKVDKLKESPDLYYENVKVSEEDLEELYRNKLVNIKEEIVKNLKIEQSLLKIDTKIKSCLKLEKAEPKEAIVLLKEMLCLELSPIMLKKHAHVVEVVRRLRKYIGNLESWNLSEEEKNTFRKDAEEVRQIALQVYVKFMHIIGQPDKGETFWDSFCNITTKFREDTKDLSEADFSMLTCELHSRTHFLNNYFIKDMPLSISFQNNITKTNESDLIVHEDGKASEK